MTNRARKSRAAPAPRRDDRGHPTAWAPDVCWWIGQAAGAVMLVYAARLWMHALRAPVAVYDEGIVLTHTFMVRNGHWPHRDFYANYPPGTWLTLNAAWSLLGQTVQAERLFAAAVHLVVVALVGRLVGRAVGRWLALLPMGLCAVWLTTIAPVAYAWMIALALALTSIELICVAAERRRAAWWVAAGVAVASIGFFRHDLFAYAVLCGGAVVGVWAWSCRAGLSRSWSASIAVPFGAALAAASLLFWVPTLVVGGARRVVDDLYLDMVRYVMPCRSLPLPSLTAWADGAPLALTGAFEFSVLLVLLAPLVGAAALRFGRYECPVARLPVLLLAALSVAVIPQMSGRSDLLHSIYAITPGLTLCFLVAYRLRPWPAAAVAVLLVTVVAARPMQLRLATAFAPLARHATIDPRLPDIPYDASRRQVVVDVRARTRPGDPIYVGMVTHRFTIASEMDLYFLAERPGGVRRMQFDPCLANQEKSQRETIAELERNQVRVAVLSHNFATVQEPSTNWREGSDVLDVYLRERFLKVADYGPYEVWERR